MLSRGKGHKSNCLHTFLTSFLTGPVCHMWAMPTWHRKVKTALMTGGVCVRVVCGVCICVCEWCVSAGLGVWCVCMCGVCVCVVFSVVCVCWGGQSFWPWGSKSPEVSPEGACWRNVTPKAASTEKQARLPLHLLHSRSHSWRRYVESDTVSCRTRIHTDSEAVYTLVKLGRFFDVSVKIKH